MKIGLVVYGSLETVSGGYFYDRQLAASLQKLGHELHVFSIPWRSDAARLAANLSFRLPPHLDVLIQDELCHPSLLSANRPPHPYPIISLVHHLRSSEDHPRVQNSLYRFVERTYLRSVDGFIFNSKTTQQEVCNLIGRGKPSVIAHPPSNRFRRVLSESVVAERAVQTGPLHILFLGSLIPRKGVSTLITAISRLPAGSVSIDLVGSMQADPAYVRKVQNQAAVLGLNASIKFHGFLDDESLQSILEQAQILVVPSSYEGFGIVYLEGMAFGLPAIGTTAGAACEIIRPGENGFLIQPGDDAALSMFLKTLILDRNRLQGLSLKALASSHQATTWEQSLESIQGFLSRLAA
jgi:glycosyltransferase involved in cell wall biosynthesis